MTEADNRSYESAAQRVLTHLRELARLTSSEMGAQRIAWSPVWRTARAWFADKVKEMDLTVEADAACNHWVTLPGRTEASVLVGSHLDSVPNGGWLDGCLGVLAGLEVLRCQLQAGSLPVTVRLVDWADEEGRFGRSLLGSAAAAGTLQIQQIHKLIDRNGIRLCDAVREYGVDVDRMLEANAHFQKCNAKAYLELHIEQGPVLESWGKSTGVVLGTVGLTRHLIRFQGQAAHAGSTPLPMRRDAFLAAAELALHVREIAQKHSRHAEGVVCTVGQVRLEPNIPTAVPGVAELTLDQRALDAEILATMEREARAASERIAQENNLSLEWRPLIQVSPRHFDPCLVQMCAEVVRETTGAAPTLASGPLHDASEIAPLVPTVMMFTSSRRGLSHCPEEDTLEEHLILSIRAFLLLADRIIKSSAPQRTQRRKKQKIKEKRN